jgi:zinc protease
MAWPAPPGDHRELPALELLVSALGDGPAGRLSRRLVEDLGVATDVTAAVELRRGPGVVRLAARAAPGVPVSQLVEAMDRELERVRTQGVEARELQGAYNRRRARAVEERLTVRGTAEALLRAILHRGRPDPVEEELERYTRVGRREVAEAARRYLIPDLRTVVTVGGEG